MGLCWYLYGLTYSLYHPGGEKSTLMWFLCNNSHRAHSAICVIPYVHMLYHSAFSSSTILSSLLTNSQGSSSSLSNNFITTFKACCLIAWYLCMIEHLVFMTLLQHKSFTDCRNTELSKLLAEDPSNKKSRAIICHYCKSLIFSVPFI